MAEDIFPFIEDLVDEDFAIEGNIPTEDALDDVDGLEEPVEEPIPYGITWKFDFNKGDIYTDSSGQTLEVTELDSLHEWIAHVLNVERGEVTIYSDEIGTTINYFIGQAMRVDGMLLESVGNDIASAINVHDRVVSVEIISLIPIGYDLYAVFSYETDDSTKIEVARL